MFLSLLRMGFEHWSLGLYMAERRGPTSVNVAQREEGSPRGPRTRSSGVKIPAKSLVRQCAKTSHLPAQTSANHGDPPKG